MQLKCINVRDDIINQILYDYEARIIKIPTLENKSYYDDRKKIIYIEDTKEIICAGYILNYYCNTNLSNWRQIRCIPAANTDTITKETVDGPRAWNYIIKILRKKYSRNTIGINNINSIELIQKIYLSDTV